MNGLTVDISDELVEKVAQRAAELVGPLPVKDDPGGYLDVAGAAEFLACKPSRIYALKSAGRIPYHKDGSRLLFDRAELRAYVEAGGATRP
jgi:excisionase family DNA binding protein